MDDLGAKSKGGVGHNGGPPLVRGGDGWVARHRSVRGHWLVGHGIHVKPADPSRKRCHTQGEAWEDLTMECRYDGGFVYNGGVKMELRRGELIGAVSYLASRWNWTPKTVRRFLDQLENDGMIELKSPGVQNGEQKGKQSTIISVCNYDIYQVQTEDEGQAKRLAEGKQGASKGQAEGNNNKDNKVTREQGNKEVEVQEEGALPLAAGAASPAIETLRAFEAYNELAQRIGLPIARSLTPQRRKQLATRIREHGGYQAWETALANIERSAFLRGTNSRGWRCNFDFLLQSASFAKVVDGTYGNGAHGPATRPHETEWERMDRLAGGGAKKFHDIEILPPEGRS